jgi:hypothetical protein
MLNEKRQTESLSSFKTSHLIITHLGNPKQEGPDIAQLYIGPWAKANFKPRLSFYTH